MTAGDWIAFAAAVAAVGSCAVALIAFRLQGRTQAAGDEEHLSDLIEKMQTGLASLPNVRREATLESMAAGGVALTSLRGQALEARKLIQRADLKPDWFQSMILAIAFSQTWDLASAGPFWTDAVVASAKAGDHPAHISSLTARAEFYYNRHLGDDWQLARDDFTAAFDELSADPDHQGPDIMNEQLSYMRLRQGSFELDAEGVDGAVPLIVDAFIKASLIAAAWRKRNALKALSNIVLELQQLAEHPDLFGKVKAGLVMEGINIDGLPADASALLSMPPDGSAFAAPPPGQDGADS
jgi:hypothetical protein